MNSMNDLDAKAYHKVNVKNLKAVMARLKDVNDLVNSLNTQVETQKLNIATMKGTITNLQAQIAVLHGKWMGTGPTE